MGWPGSTLAVMMPIQQVVETLPFIPLLTTLKAGAKIGETVRREWLSRYQLLFS
jgi:hypothetical protein